MKKIVTGSLTQWNIGLAALYAVQGIVILILSQARELPVTTSFLVNDTLASKVSGHSVLAPATHHLFDVNLAVLVAIFLFVAAIAHLSAATWYRRKYEGELSQNANRLRWIEYALSASFMIVAISLLAGVQEIAILVGVFGLSVVANLIWLVMESHSRGAKRADWSSYVLGCLAGVLPWIVIGIYLLGSGIYGSPLPSFVYWIAASTFVLFLLGAANTYLQFKKVGKWSNYEYGERTFMILGLVTMAALAWQIFAGTLR